jgi:fatty-acyl-CoA synthase
VILPSEAFDPRAVLDAVAAERCTALHGVPTMFIAELGLPDFASFGLGTLRTGIMAGSPCPIELMRRVVGEMNMREVTIVFGMTESSACITQTRFDDTIERRVTTVGRAHPHVEVKIVDAAGRVVPPGAEGEICFRGYNRTRGYWDDPARTAEAIDEAGWLHTGDLGSMDEDGYLNIVGRLKDIVIRGGENIAPREVEEFLYRHPKVEAAQAFGVPDAKYGEELCAWIRLRAGETADEEEIRAYCRGRIAHYKIPRYVRFVAEFPMTASGKVQKFVMRDAMRKELGLTEAKSA